MKKYFICMVILINSILSFSQPPDINMYITPINFNSAGSQKHDIKVFLKDGTTIIGSSAILTDIASPFFVRINNKKIEPEDTDSMLIGFCMGYPQDDRWIFAIERGTISAYSYEPGIENEKFTFLKKRGEPLTKYSYKVLETYVSDNPAALDTLQSYRNSMMTKYCLIGTSVGFLVASITQFKGESQTTSFKVCVGMSALFALLSYAPDTKGKKLSSIKTYNAKTN